VTGSVFMAFLHHVAAFALVAGMAVELALLRAPIDLRRARRLVAIDAVVGLAAATVVLAGVLRVLRFEKGADWYLANGAFHAKMALFVLVALLSLYPTVRFLAWRSALKRGEAPPVDDAGVARLRRVLHLELAGIVLVLLAAAAMARGTFVQEAS
jgi:putative membrane protein